jgi:hypothetical protein
MSTSVGQQAQQRLESPLTKIITGRPKHAAAQVHVVQLPGELLLQGRLRQRGRRDRGGVLQPPAHPRARARGSVATRAGTSKLPLLGVDAGNGHTLCVATARRGGSPRSSGCVSYLTSDVGDEIMLVVEDAVGSRLWIRGVKPGKSRIVLGRSWWTNTPPTRPATAAAAAAAAAAACQRARSGRRGHGGKGGLSERRGRPLPPARSTRARGCEVAAHPHRS